LIKEWKREIGMHKLLNNEKLIVSFDLGDECSQISYCVTGSEVESLSSVAGGEEFDIPTVLCKRQGVNQWFYGKEALRYAEEKDGILIRNLLQLAVEGEMQQIDEKPYDPVALLTLFIRRCLGMLSQISSPDKIAAMMFTCESLDARLIEVLGQVAAGLKLKPEQVCFQNHTESFYNYMIYQPAELWNFQVLLCDYRGSSMKVYRMECNKKTRPIVAFIDSEEYPFPSYEPMPQMESLRGEKLKHLDAAFLDLVTSVCQNHLISSAFLVGEHFSEEWLKDSLKYLCRGRRVFQGNNLYCKGACFGMQERISASEEGKSHVFLGNDKLKANIGMQVMRRGESSYFALLDAGVNWFEAERVMECYLQEGNTLEFVVTPLIGKNVRIKTMVLEELSGDITRIRLHLYMQGERSMIVEVEELGFGEIHPSGKRIWREEIELYEKIG